MWDRSSSHRSVRRAAAPRYAVIGVEAGLMEVWRESDDVRVATAQERLMRERPLRVHVSDEWLGRAYAQRGGRDSIAGKNGRRGKGPAPSTATAVGIRKTGAAMLMFHPRGQVRPPRPRSAARRAGLRGDN